VVTAAISTAIGRGRIALITTSSNTPPMIHGTTLRQAPVLRERVRTVAAVEMTGGGFI
jgi:hypothetical protein